MIMSNRAWLLLTKKQRYTLLVGLSVIQKGGVK